MIRQSSFACRCKNVYSYDKLNYVKLLQKGKEGKKYFQFLYFFNFYMLFSSKIFQTFFLFRIFFLFFYLRRILGGFLFFAYFYFRIYLIKCLCKEDIEKCCMLHLLVFIRRKQKLLVLVLFIYFVFPNNSFSYNNFNF